MGLLTGKRALVMGMLDDGSIAWAIAQAFVAEGAEVSVTYAGDSGVKRVAPLVEGIGGKSFRCDVTNDADLDALPQHFELLDILVHSLAFTPPATLKGSFLDAATREAFRQTMEVSVQSLPAIASRVVPLMTEGGSIITMSYLGSERALPNYNLMGPAKAALEATVRYMANELGERGIRVNAISPGPIATRSANAIKGFDRMLEHHQRWAPLRRNTTREEVAGAALSLASDRLSGGITGQITYVDGGYNTVGAPPLEI